MSQTPSSSTTHTSCGCGGGEPGCSCSCGQAECGGCETRNLVRPRFFAGQLLTEDDLELLTAYVGAKGRLHNRHLHGDGVVCGLEVTCHPCGGGKVRVHPGHALDCCGNDILVPCTKELDILEMIRRLRIDQLGGHDCGDPCAEEEGKGGIVFRDSTPTPEAERQRRRYCLYVRYCEELTDPVAPYATEEPCGERPCEPTRVREGFRFELRCPEEESLPESIIDRIRCCFGDLKQLKNLLAGATVREGWHGRHLAATAYADAAVPARFEEADLAKLQEATAALGAFGSGGWGDQEPSPLTGAELQQALDLHHFVGQGVIRARLAEADAGGPQPAPVTGKRRGAKETGSDEDRVAGDRVAGDRFTLVGYAAEVWSQVAPRIETSIPNLSQVYPRELAKATLSQQQAWIVQERSADELRSFEGRYVAYDGVTSSELTRFDNSDLTELRQWLLNQLEGKKKQSDCRLRQEVLSIRLADPANVDPAAGIRLQAAFKRYLVDCLCQALLPPCPPCDDPAVLLACLTVEECEVVDICNLERTFVFSGPAIRYWLPQLGSLGRLIERLCCEPPKPPKLPQPEPSTPPPYFRLSTFSDAAATYERAERKPLDVAFDFSGVPAATSAMLAGVTGGYNRELLGFDGALPGLSKPGGLDGTAVLEAFTDRQVQEHLDRLVSSRVEEAAPPPLEAERLAELVRSEPVQGVLAEELQDEMSAAAEAEAAARAAKREIERVSAAAEAAARAASARIEEVAAEAGTAAGEVRGKVESAAAKVTRVERAMKSRLTATSLRDTKVVKDLKSANSALKESVRSLERFNQELVQRLERLEKPEPEEAR